MHILLLHGALGSASQIQPLRALLADFPNVEVLELDGHGDTPATRDAFSIERFADDVRHHVGQQGLERVALFGYSMGGYVALELAADSPDCVAGVATLGTKLAWTPDVAARETGRLDPEMIRTKVPKFATMLEKRHAGAGGWERVLDKTARMMTELGHRPTLDDVTIARIAPPVCLMVGDRDAVVNVDETLAAAKAMPKGEGCVLPNTPHPFEQVRLPMLAAMLGEFFHRCAS